MTVRFLADANFSMTIVGGLLRREPTLDFETADQAELHGKPDAEVLSIAAGASRILVTHDAKTIPSEFARFIARQNSPGVILVPQKLSIGIAIEELLMVYHASSAEEWLNTFTRLPL